MIASVSIHKETLYYLVDGDVIGVQLHLLAKKPDFLKQKNNSTSTVEATDCQPDKAKLNLEISDGSYIKFFKNGVEQKY